MSETYNPGRDRILERIRGGLRAAPPAPTPTVTAEAAIFEAVGDPYARFLQEAKANLMECLPAADVMASANALAQVLDSLPVGEIFVQDHPTLRRLIEAARVGLEPHLHAVAVDVGRNLAIRQKQRELAMLPAPFIKGFDQMAPGLTLAAIDLAEIQHLALDDLAASTTPVLDNIPIAMLLAVFEASVGSQEHDPTQLQQQPEPEEDGRSTLQAIENRAALIRLVFLCRHPTKVATRGRQLVKSG